MPLDPRRHSALRKQLRGTHVNTKIALADELAIGSMRIRHVFFLVLPDHQPPVNEQSPGWRGLIGTPVLEALDRFVWGADKSFTIEPESLHTDVPHASLCFDENHPIVQVADRVSTPGVRSGYGRYGYRPLPPFAAAFPELIRSAKETNSYNMEGVSGAKYMEAATLESLQSRFGLGTHPVPDWRRL